MKACGVIVEYNPFHNGHNYHVQKARDVTNADCIIAIMSGSFLQRGEPAIIDKFGRTRTALQCGVDLVIELPYAYSVQSSRYFAKGALLSLHSLNVSSVCFGSESGEVKPFYDSAQLLRKEKDVYDDQVRTYLQQGLSFPAASNKAYLNIGIKNIDLAKPNNILGFSYINTIIRHNLPIKPFTIKRKENDYHDEEITNKIASATSIRKELLHYKMTKKIKQAVPNATVKQLQNYITNTSLWHHWELYFPFLHYRISTMDQRDLFRIHGVDEGLQYRLKRTAPKATSFTHWLSLLKTKRYTQTRLQRMFTHILTNTTKEEINEFLRLTTVPYIRLLGMNKTGQAYLNEHKKNIFVPIISNLTRANQATFLDERALHAYYSVLDAKTRKRLRKQEFHLPIIID